MNSRFSYFFSFIVLGLIFACSTKQKPNIITIDNYKINRDSVINEGWKSYNIPSKKFNLSIPLNWDNAIEVSDSRLVFALDDTINSTLLNFELVDISSDYTLAMYYKRQKEGLKNIKEVISDSLFIWKFEQFDLGYNKVRFYSDSQLINLSNYAWIEDNILYVYRIQYLASDTKERSETIRLIFYNLRKSDNFIFSNKNKLLSIEHLEEGIFQN